MQFSGYSYDMIPYKNIPELNKKIQNTNNTLEINYIGSLLSQKRSEIDIEIYMK